MKIPKINIVRIFNFVSETGSLMFMKRTHYRSLLNTFDSVSSHCHHTAIIGYTICRMEGLSHQESLNAIAMGVFHDIAESRTGDLDYINKHYSTRDEDIALNHILQNLPFTKDIEAIIHEYEKRESLVAKCVKDADIIEQIYQEWVLMYTGNQLAKRWFDGSKKHRYPYLRTKSAKKLYKQMQKSHPHDWWLKDLVEQGINQIFLNGKK